MSVRIHKAIGYGLDDVMRGKQKVSDKRINSKALYGLDHITMEEFIKWCDDNIDELDSVLKNEREPCDAHHEFRFMCHDMKYNKQFNVFNNIIYNDENVLLFIPPNHPNWYRFDDPIDFEEETLKDRNSPAFTPMRPHASRLNSSGIYPYNTGMIRFRDPKRSMKSYLADHWPADDLGPTIIKPSIYARLVGTWDPDQEPQATGIFFKHLIHDFRPRIPFGVLALILWSGIFKDLKTINELRPLLYTYWD